MSNTSKVKKTQSILLTTTTLCTNVTNTKIPTCISTNTHTHISFQTIFVADIVCYKQNSNDILSNYTISCRIFGLMNCKIEFVL